MLLQRFGTVIERFRARGEGSRDPEQCFVVRTLLIHAYRRALLRDPQLPPALLPLDWPGAAAFALCRDFYRLTHRDAERHLMATLEGERGPLPPAGAAFARRFGGLSGPDRPVGRRRGLPGSGRPSWRRRRRAPVTRRRGCARRSGRPNATTGASGRPDARGADHAPPGAW